MTVVVIFIMIAFVGGTALQQLLSRMGGTNRVVAYWGDKNKITAKDVMQAQSELNVLRMLMFDRLFSFGLGDLRSTLLAQLLFADPQTAAMVSDQLKKAVMAGQLSASNKDIDTFFTQAQGRSEIYWILLKDEAKQAGWVVSKAQAKEILKQVVPQLTRGQADAQQLVNYAIKNNRMPEREIIGAVADIWAISSYARMMTSNEDITINQVKAAVGREAEKINAEFVKISASDFVGEQAEPAPEELGEQFEQYKQFTPGLISQTNPYGFGYKLPARVALEYLILKLDDVQTLVTEPTLEETEEFYRKNVNLPEYQPVFKYEVQFDPNDPESKVQNTRTYAEVLGQIQRIMTQEKTNRQADMIMSEAIELTEMAFAGADIGQASAQELEKLAADYKQTAAKLSEKYKIKIHTGLTGMLGPTDVAADRYLSTLSAGARTQAPSPLSKVVFAIDEIGTVELGRFDVAKPRIWQNIGPMKDMFGSIIALVRVTKAEKESVPVDLNMSFNNDGVILDETQQQAQNIYAVKDRVTEDLKLIKAMQLAKARAEELVKLIDLKDWDEALQELNKIYSDKQGPLAPKLRVDKLSELTRLSLMDIKTARAQSSDNPARQMFVRSRVENKMLLDKLYSLLPAGQTEAANITSVLEFEPGASYYVIKNVSRTAATTTDYYDKKSKTAFTLNAGRSESLGLVHFGSENIFKRTRYRVADEKGKDPGKNTKEKKSGGAS
jgi:hypothetical protein